MHVHVGPRGVAVPCGALVVLAASGRSTTSKSANAGAGAVTSGSANAGPAMTVPGPMASRGFDGKTIKLAGIGAVVQFAGAGIGAEARFQRANDTNELNGIRNPT
jgi:hypothetical protein